MKGTGLAELLASLPVAPDEFTASLLGRIQEQGGRADALIEAASKGWPLHRMAVLDRLVLRLAVVELLDPHGPPVAVVIDEAVELAKTYSTDDSGRFVNGVLSAVAAQVR